MGEVTSFGWYEQHYGKLPASSEAVNLIFFAKMVPGFLAELRAFSAEGGDQLSRLFAGAQLGVIELFTTVQEKTAALLLRSFFGFPNQDLEGAVPVALQLQSKEAVATGEVVDGQSNLRAWLENCAQVIAPMVKFLTEQLLLVEAKIAAKAKALRHTETLDLHASVIQDKADFAQFTDKRLETLMKQRAALQKRLQLLVELFSGFVLPLRQEIRQLPARLTTVQRPDATRAIPVGPVAQPA